MPRSLQGDGDQVSYAPVPVPTALGEPSQGENCLLVETTAWGGAQGPGGSPQQLQAGDPGRSASPRAILGQPLGLSTPADTNLGPLPPSWAARELRSPVLRESRSLRFTSSGSPSMLQMSKVRDI